MLEEPSKGFGPVARAHSAGSGGADFEDGRAVRRRLQLHGMTVVLDLAGAAVGQDRNDLGLGFSAGARRLFLSFYGPRAGGDEAVNHSQPGWIEAAAAGCRNGLRLSGSAAAAIGADDALPGDDALGGHCRGAVGVKGGRRLAEHLDEDGWAPLDAMQCESAVVLGQA